MPTPCTSIYTGLSVHYIMNNLGGTFCLIVIVERKKKLANQNSNPEWDCVSLHTNVF